jgi:hypothetical protein
VAGDVRGGDVRAVKLLAAEGKPLSSSWKHLIEDDFAGAMRTLSQFLPKEHAIDMNSEHSITLVSLLTSIQDREPDKHLINQGVTLEGSPVEAEAPRRVSEAAGDDE